VIIIIGVQLPTGTMALQTQVLCPTKGSTGAAPPATVKVTLGHSTPADMTTAEATELLRLLRTALSALGAPT
jgi:hypothetical protein